MTDTSDAQPSATPEVRRGAPSSEKNLGVAEKQQTSENWRSTSSILQLHIAEYSALTTRITYWITLQFSIAPVATGALILLATTYPLFSLAVMGWAAVVIVDAFLCVYYYTLFEIMSNSQYIECDLAPRIREIVPDALFWQYENYRNRSSFYSPRGLYIPVIISIGVTLAGLWLRWPPLSNADRVGVFAAAVLAVWALLLVRATARTQENFWRCATKGKPPLPAHEG